MNLVDLDRDTQKLLDGARPLIRKDGLPDVPDGGTVLEVEVPETVADAVMHDEC